MDAPAHPDPATAGRTPWRAEVPQPVVRAAKRRTPPPGHVPAAGRAWRFLCLAEIDNFTDLRRHLGRTRADRLVLDVAARVGQVMPDARLGVVGRNLVEIAFEADERGALDTALTALEAAFAAATDFDHESYRLEMLFGAAAARAIGCDEVRLIEEAEEALALARGDDQHPIVRDLTELKPAIDRSTLSRELPAAIAAGQLFLQFQPKVHLRRQEIVGVEALVRWEHPERGLVLPSDFIPSAEESRHIGPLTLWTLRQVIADQRTLAGRGHDIPVFINISGQLLGDQPFVAEAIELVRGGGAKIGFEITETSVIRDPDSAIANLERFADIGIPIAIDDYGAGLSSLAYLKRLPARELKIDKLFVTQLTSSNRDPLIVRSTIDLAHALEMEVTAEGVESQAALALLSVMGCDMVQGYLISRPVALDALLHYLDQDQHLGATVDPRASFGGLASAWKRA
ncbi:MAG: EAL domain-containing protein [Pseudomonadota bacterium]